MGGFLHETKIREYMVFSSENGFAWIFRPSWRTQYELNRLSAIIVPTMSWFQERDGKMGRAQRFETGNFRFMNDSHWMEGHSWDVLRGFAFMQRFVSFVLMVERDKLLFHLKPGMTKKSFLIWDVWRLESILWHLVNRGLFPRRLPCMKSNRSRLTVAGSRFYCWIL